MAKPDLVSSLKNVSERDRKQIEQAREMFGPDPDTMGLVKNLFWGRIRDEIIVPYPDPDAEEIARCDPDATRSA